MQKQGTIQLPSKVGYAIGKNLTHTNKIGKDFEDFKKEQMRLRVEQDKNGKYGTINVNGQEEWQFKSDKDRESFLESIETYLSQEIPFIEHKISLEDLKQVHNIPVDTLAALEEFEITTELSLAGSVLSISK